MLLPNPWGIRRGHILNLFINIYRVCVYVRLPVARAFIRVSPCFRGKTIKPMLCYVKEFLKSDGPVVAELVHNKQTYLQKTLLF